MGYRGGYRQLSKDLRSLEIENVFFFCVGTDRSTGDSLAPLVGTWLKDKGYKNVLGTIDDPVHALNIADKIEEIPEDVTVIAIDASLGSARNIGKTKLEEGSLQAGIGLGKSLPEVGDYHIKGVVNIASDIPMTNFAVLQNTRLKTVFEMSNNIVKAIEKAFPIKKKRGNLICLK